MSEMKTDDLALLRQYYRGNSETAFAELVARHVNLVYSVAIRKVSDPHLAEEITQAVFIILARKAGSLDSETILSAWLCRTARYTSANALTMQRRRQNREQEAHMQSLLNETESDAWKQVAPLLDGAMEQLGEKDHDVIVLRFFEGKKFKDIARELGSSEEAVKMRANRALEKLRRFFLRRGVALSTTLVVGILSSNAVQAAPAALAKTIAAGMLAKGAVAGGSVTPLINGGLKLMAWAKAKTAITTGAAIFLAVGSATIAVKTMDAMPMGSSLASLADSQESLTNDGVPAPASPASAKSGPDKPGNEDLFSILKETNAYLRMKDITAYLDSLPSTKIADALPEIEKSTSDNRDQALSFLTERWMVTDPAEAQQAARATKDRHTKELMMKEVYATLAAKDPADAISQAKQLQDKLERSTAIAGIIQQLTRQDPARALAFFEETKSTVSSGLMEPIFSGWAEKDLNQASQAALQLTRGNQRYVAIGGIIEQLLSKDSQSAIAFVEQLPSGPTQDEARKRLTYALIENKDGAHDFQDASKYVSNVPGHELKKDLISEVAFQWALVDPHSALVWMGSLLSPLTEENVVTNAVSKWAQDDPHAAINYVKGLTVPEMDKDRLNQSLVSGWAQIDPTSALAWIDQLPTGEAKNNALNRAISAWAEKSPQEALTYVNALSPDTPGKSDLLRSAALQWSKGDPKAALVWINQLPVGKDKDAVLDAAVSQWSNDEPAKAAAYVDSMPDVAVQQSLLASVAGNWAGYDPNAAVQWLTKFPDSQQKTDAYAQIAGAWAQSDPTQTSSWLLQLPSGPSRDAAIQSFSGVVVSSDPDAAYKWAQSMENTDDRQKQVISVLKSWMQSDPTSAAVAVQNSSLAPEQKRALLQPNHQL